jgi:16S rRNA (cytosine1402-N4)-methyltransferase
MSHTPVLLENVLQYLDPQPGECIVDGTIDGGGHAAEILKRIGDSGMLIGIDKDERMIEGSRERFANRNNVMLAADGYENTEKILKAYGIKKIDGLLLDLGFSSEQLAPPVGGIGRGFSFMNDEPLLMTYDAQRQSLRDKMRGIREDELAKIIFEFGEERYARRIAEAIVYASRKKKIETTGELTKIISNAAPRGYERGRIHPATRTFQALRIWVNNELENLKTILTALPNIMNVGGRVVVISFHSLEDRIVKQELRRMKKEERAELLTKKPVEATAEEIRMNPRSRSAKLRAIKMA